MKRTWRNIFFAFFAAAALIFASSCSDDPTGELSRTLSPITEGDVLAFMQEIGLTRGVSTYLASNAGWDFPNATLGEDAGGLVVDVPWVVTLPAKPNIWDTLNYLKEVGEVSTSLLSVDLSSVAWDDYEEEGVTGRRQAGKGESGKRYVTVTIELAAGASRDFPQELRSVAIALDSGDDVTWLNVIPSQS